MILRRMRVMLEALQDEVRPVDAPLEEPVIPHPQLEASPAAEEAAPEPALTGASGHPGRATRRAVPARPRPGRRTPALTPGKPGSRHPRARGNQAGVAMGPRTRRLPGPGVITVAQASSS